MTPEAEQKVLSTMYNRLYDAVTFSPGDGKGSAFDRATTFLQFSKNEAVNPQDFINAATPTNPKGNLTTAETFSRMVDVVPSVQVDFARNGVLSDVYGQIVKGANADPTLHIDPKQQHLYDKAYGYLNTSTTITDMNGTAIKTDGPSPIYNTYLSNRTAYISAISAYRTSYNGYNLENIDDQRKWQANEPLLSNAVDQAYRTWRSAGAAQVEEALGVLDTSLNSMVRNALTAARDAIDAKNQMASSLGGPHWFLSYALPTNWYDPAAAQNFSTLTLSSEYLDSKTDSNYTSYGGGGSGSYGLWSVGGSAQHSSESTSYHMTASKFSLSAKLGVVSIYRPWLHEFIFAMNGWYVDGKPQGGISTGALANNTNSLLPLIPTAFIVARDIAITADFTSEDKQHIASATSGSASVGWGPFSVSGNYSHSESHDTFKSTFDGGTLKIPGIQIIAWLSEIVPNSAPMSTPGGSTSAKR